MDANRREDGSHGRHGVNEAVAGGGSLLKPAAVSPALREKQVSESTSLLRTDFRVLLPAIQFRGEESRSCRVIPSPLTSSDTRTLAVYLDADSQSLLVQAAELRRISVSDYVRAVTIPLARPDVEPARGRTISLSAEEQLAFWQMPHAPAELTPAQKQLGTLMQGRK